MAFSDQGINMSETIEWYEFFSNNNLAVFDVIHGALSVAIFYWPDDFLKKRDAIIKFLYSKKPFKYKNKNNGSDHGDIKSSDHMPSPPPPPPPLMSFQEAHEWYEFFSNNHLAVFDVLHGALSVAVLFWPDDFLKKRDEIAQFVNAKKPFQYKNKKIASSSGDTESSDHPVADHMPSSPPPSSMSFQEPSPPTTLDRKDTSKHNRLEANTEETKPKSSTSYENMKSLPTKSDTRKPKKEISTQKTGLRGRLNKKKKQNHHESLVGELLLKDSSKDHHHVQVSSLSATTANKGNPGRSAETFVSSSSEGAKGTSGFKKVNSAVMAKMKLQTSVDLHDEATLERKLEDTKRKLSDGYKNAQAAKKRIRLIDAH